MTAPLTVLGKIGNQDVVLTATRNADTGSVGYLANEKVVIAGQRYQYQGRLTLIGSNKDSAYAKKHGQTVQS